MTPTGRFPELKRRILNRVQHDFPISPEPYVELAVAISAELPCTPEQVHEAVQELRREGVIRRIGGSFAAGKVGYVSTLVAARVDPDCIEAAAARASARPEVTHNYEREGAYNLWFTVTASGQDRIDEILADVRACRGVHSVHALPALKTFKIRVAFEFDEEADDA